MKPRNGLHIAFEKQDIIGIIDNKIKRFFRWYQD
jgi:hypothetical protein